MAKQITKEDVHEFFANLPDEKIRRISEIKWQCLRRNYERHDYFTNENYFHAQCAFCLNADFLYEFCKIDHDLCDMCYHPKHDDERDDDYSSLFKRMISVYENDQNILPLIKEMIKGIKEGAFCRSSGEDERITEVIRTKQGG